MVALARFWGSDYIVEELLNEADGLGIAATSLILERQTQRFEKEPSRENEECGAWWAHSFGLRARYGILNFPPETSLWISSIHLLRRIIQTAWPGGNPPRMYRELCRTIIPQTRSSTGRSQLLSARRVAILQILPLFEDNKVLLGLPNVTQSHQDEGRPSLRDDILDIIQDEEETGAVRALALHILSVVLRPTATTLEELRPESEDVLTLCMGVLLWKTRWQHNLADDEVNKIYQQHTCDLTLPLQQKRFNIEKLRPHDDAYAILCDFPAATLIPLVRNAIAVSERLAILEPLMALIVDQSAMNGRNWPKVFSSLIDAGLVPYFHDIASSPVPDPNDRPLWRSITDAFVGLMRCFEHMTEQQLLNVAPEVIGTLDRTADDGSVPLIVSRSASDARKTLQK